MQGENANFPSGSLRVTVREFPSASTLLFLDQCILSIVNKTLNHHWCRVDTTSYRMGPHSHEVSSPNWCPLWLSQSISWLGWQLLGLVAGSMDSMAICPLQHFLCQKKSPWYYIGFFVGVPYTLMMTKTLHKSNSYTNIQKYVMIPINMNSCFSQGGRVLM